MRRRCKPGKACSTTDVHHFARHIWCSVNRWLSNHPFYPMFWPGWRFTENSRRKIESHKLHNPTYVFSFLAGVPPNHHRVIQSWADKKGLSRRRGIGAPYRALLTLAHSFLGPMYMWNMFTSRISEFLILQDSTAVAKSTSRWLPCNPVVLSTLCLTRRPTRVRLSNESSATLARATVYLQTGNCLLFILCNIYLSPTMLFTYCVTSWCWVGYNKH